MKISNHDWPNWGKIILSPFIISLLTTTILVVLLSPSVPKYKITVTKIMRNTLDLEIYCDLSGDGISDRITLNNDSAMFFSIVIYENPSGVINQWNFEGELLTRSNDYLIVGDYDKNNKNELYIFSLNHDSIMLHCIHDLNNNKPSFKNVFISKVGFRKGKYEAAILKAEMDDLNDDGFKELIFAVNSGFSLTPRNIFAYDIKNKKIISSPFLGMSMTKLIQKDITGDGKNEILIQGHGSDNISDTTIKYHDRSAWLMVLDRKLDFLFEPKEYKGAYSHIYPFVFESNNSFNQAGFYTKTTLPPYGSKLSMFDPEGKILREKYLPGIPYNAFYTTFSYSNKGNSFIVLSKRDKKELLVVDRQLNIAEEESKITLSHVESLDLDQDGLNELISFDNEEGKLIVLRDNLKHPALIDLTLNTSTLNYSFKENGKNPPELVIWDHLSTTYLTYGKNSLYYLRWLIYLGIYLAFLAFTWIILWVQRYQINQKINTEKKISELQMKIVKNQLDPHFTLNAINSIIHSIRINESENAADHLLHFSNLYRHLLLTADQYYCSLKEELAFTENYLKMEQLRFRDKFIYTISVSNDVNQEIEIPKMCIQTAAENAIKHGISPLKAGGVIKISAFLNNNLLVIKIGDNGIGRSTANTLYQTSTHMGTRLTQQYFELFSRLTNRRATLEIQDLFNESENASGTNVIVKIQLN
jgi:hypothetical protein